MINSRNDKGDLNKDNSDYANLMNDFGVVYYKLSDNEKAFQYYSSAL